MDSIRKTALLAGVLYLLTFISSIPAAFLLGPAQTDPTSTLSAIPDGQVRLAAVLELVNALACIGTAVAVFSIVKREHEGLALGFVATRLFEAATLVIGIVAILTLASLREAGAATDGVASALVSIRYWTIIIGPGMAAFNALMFGTLLYRSRLVPRAIPALGIVGAPLLISFVVGTMLGITAPGNALQGIAVAPFFFWELMVGFWMTFKGFDRSAPILADVAARPSEAPGRTTVSTTAGVA